MTVPDPDRGFFDRAERFIFDLLIPLGITAVIGAIIGHAIGMLI